MGILDWFKNRSAQFDAEQRSDALTEQAIEKAVVLTNPRLKLVRAYQDRLGPAVETSVAHLRRLISALPAPIRISAANWGFDPVLRAFFATPSDITTVLGRSHNVRTLFEKFPELDEAHVVLGMAFSEQKVRGLSLQGGGVPQDAEATMVSFADHQVRICGQEEREIRRLLGTQLFEYLVAQALIEIGEDRSERRELEDERSLIRARLRLLQQQGPGLGTVFGSAPGAAEERAKLEAQLIENERQMEMIGGSDSILEGELEHLQSVLANPERYVRIEHKDLRLSTMNVMLDETSTDVACDVSFSLAELSGSPSIRSAFVLGTFARAELPPERMNFDDAIRYL